jgi:DNA-binding PadR family transcriptional regulator
MDEVTEGEALVLSLIERMQPITAYQIRKVLAESPTTNISNSTGKIYPIIRRLKDSGLISATAVEDDGRGAEHLTCTEQGRQVIRQWVKIVDRAHLLLEDPLRTKILSFDLLSKGDQVRWLKAARADLVAKLDEIKGYARKYPGPYIELAHENARLATAARIAWIDLALKKIGKRETGRATPIASPKHP